MADINVRVIPTQASMILRLRAAKPWLSVEQIAWQLDTHPNVVRMALALRVTGATPAAAT